MPSFRSIVSNGLRLLPTARPRSLRQFAEDEIVPATGRYKNLPFRVHRQPFCGLLLDSIDNPRWRTVVITGPSQSAKTICGFTIPTLHSIYELRENCVLGIPELGMANDKFKEDIFPVLANSPRLKAIIPIRGPGSAGGTVRDAIQFANGVRVKIITRGGQDTAKAGYTGRIVLITEAAGWSYATGTSSEADTFRQLSARQKGFRHRERKMIIEGTVTIPDELPWRMHGTPERLTSTMSRLVVPCPHCGEWITPEREHLMGWQDAATERQAEDLAYFVCPACERKITEGERRDVNQQIRLLHFGQTIEDDQVTGDPPEVSTLWFRWSHFNNLLLEAADAAIEEYKAAQIPEDTRDRYDAEKALCQFTWCRPYEVLETEEIPLTVDEVFGRVSETLRRGVLPTEAVRMTCGVDLRASQVHYCVIAWMPNGAGIRIDYGVLPTDARRLGTRRGVLLALRKLRDEILFIGYRDATGRTMSPQVVFCDMGWKPEVTRAWVRETRQMGHKGYYPCRGHGQSEPANRGGYTHPTRLTNLVVFIGDQYHLKQHPKHGLAAAIINSDEWKSYVHDNLAIDQDQPGALTTFEPITEDEIRLHRSFSQETCAEKAVEIVKEDRGPVTVWRNTSHRRNHGLDVTYYACAAGHFAGVRIIEPKLVPRPRQTPRPMLRTTDDDQPYLVSARRD